MPDPNEKKTYVDPDTLRFVTEEQGQVRSATEEEAEQTAEKWEKDKQAGEDDVKRRNS